MKFFEKYDDVFDEMGNVKACGRVKRRELIHEAKKLDSGTDFGSEDEGFMNIDNIKNLHDKLIEQNI